MKLVWSNLARAELAEIRRYSVDTWGRATAIRYMRDLRDAARTVAADPTRARPLRKSWCIIRDERTNTLTVARVLHVAMDIERHLPPEAGTRPVGGTTAIPQR